MRWYKIAAMIWLDFRIFRNTKWHAVELLYFPLTTVVIWGLFSLYVQETALATGLIVLIANIFWSFAQSSQSTINQSMNEDIWSGSLKQILVSGISEFEYLAGRIISSSLVTFFVMAMLLATALYGFGATVIATHGLALSVFIIMAWIGALTLAVIVAGLIIMFGREYTFFAWASIQIFVLLSAPFYPIEIYPEIVRPIVQVMPFTYAFEGVRTIVTTGTAATSTIIAGFAVVAAYAAVAIPFYAWVYRRARRTGGLVMIS